MIVRVNKEEVKLPANIMRTMPILTIGLDEWNIYPYPTVVIVITVS